MKNFKKLICLLMGYLFMVTLLPSTLFVHAENAIPKYLQTQEGYAGNAYQYKDTTVFNTYDIKTNENSVQVLKNAQKKSSYKNNYFFKGQSKNEIILESTVEKSSEKVLNLDNDQLRELTQKDFPSDESLYICTESEGISVNSPIEAQEHTGYSLKRNEKFYGIEFNPNKKTHVPNYDKEYKINEDTYIFVLYDYFTDTTSVDKFKFKDNKLVYQKTLLEDKNGSMTQDSNGNMWMVKDGYVSKLIDDNFVRVYEVDKEMDGLSVYNDNHMIVTSCKEVDKKLTGKYTVINTEVNQNNNDNKQETKPEAKPETKPEVNTEIKPVDSTGKQTISVNKLQNKVEVKFDEKTKEATLELQDINTIKEGKGIISADLGTTTVNLPFEAIDKSLLVDGAKVLLRAKVEENSDITSKLNGVKKIYNFDLIVKNGDNETSIHQFKNGQAEVTINVSDDDLQGLNRDRLAVFYYNEETKSFEMMETKVDGNIITFKTPHFSKYVIAEKQNGESKLPQSKVTESKLPATGSNINTTNILLGGLVLAVLGGVLLRRRHHA